MTSHWIPHTLRARLTTWHITVIVIVLSVYIAVVLLLVTRNLSATLDARLRSDFRWAAEMAQQTPRCHGTKALPGGPIAPGFRYGRRTGSSSTARPSPTAFPCQAVKHSRYRQTEISAPFSPTRHHFGYSRKARSLSANRLSSKSDGQKRRCGLKSANWRSSYYLASH